MFYLKNFDFKSLLPVLFLIVSSLAFAQQPQTPELREDFTDKELAAFVKANKKVTAIQAESEQKMVKAIQESGLSVDRFNQIIANQQNPQEENDASEEEMASFNSAAQVIMSERQKSETKIMQSIENKGIDIDTYQEIMYAYQQSPKIQNKINELLEN